MPLVLVVFGDKLAAGHSCGVAAAELRWAGVKMPLWVSHRNDLERSDPLGTGWQTPSSWESIRVLGQQSA